MKDSSGTVRMWSGITYTIHLKKVFDVVDLSGEGERGEVGLHGCSVVGVKPLRELFYQLVYFIHRVHHSTQHLYVYVL